MRRGARKSTPTRAIGYCSVFNHWLITIATDNFPCNLSMKEAYLSIRSIVNERSIFKYKEHRLLNLNSEEIKARDNGIASIIGSYQTVQGIITGYKKGISHLIPFFKAK